MVAVYWVSAWMGFDNQRMYKDHIWVDVFSGILSPDPAFGLTMLMVRTLVAVVAGAIIFSRRDVTF
ncbi:MAG TPA: hypothetical protein VE975_08725 [Actinomycetota bacterium]|jgi:hypothetical protein|nr:hypothetical protein [Actinomycetota bacterium]